MNHELRKYHGAWRHTGSCAVAVALTGLGLLSASGTARAAGVPGQGTWETTLQGRDLDGNSANGFEAYYDTVLNITWLGNANLAASNTFGLAYNKNLGNHPDDRSGWTYEEVIHPNGRIAYGAALHWLDAMNSSNYLGYSDWRLPTVKPINGTNFQYIRATTGTTDLGFNISSAQSEMAHLYHVTLGNVSRLTPDRGVPAQMWGLMNHGPFSNLQSFIYWSGSEYAPNSGGNWTFSFFDGDQTGFFKRHNTGVGSAFNAFVVRSGDVVSPVPEPQTIALALAGLAVAGGAARMRRRA